MSVKEEPKKDNKLLGVILSQVTVIMFCSCSVFIKYAAQSGVTSGDIAIVRTATMFICAQPIRLMMGKGITEGVPSDQYKWLVLRGVLGIFSFGLAVAAIYRIPLAAA